MDTQEKEIAILIVGKTGTGKSATGNSILNQTRFTSSTSTSHVPEKVECGTSDFEGTRLNVVDIRGLENNANDIVEDIKLVADAVEEAFSINPGGYHVILIVLRYGARLTQEDIDTIKIFKGIFGKDFTSVHSILLLTHGDEFSANMDCKNLKFKEWCGEQTGFFKELYEECRHRVFLFDNMTKDEKDKNDQLRSLLQMINHLTACGAHYTKAIFQKAKKSRDSLMKDPADVLVSGNIMKELGIIKELLDNFSGDEETRLEALRGRVEIVEDDIEKECKSSTSISVATPHSRNVWEKFRLLESDVNSRLRQTEHSKTIEQMLKEKDLKIGKLEKRIMESYYGRNKTDDGTGADVIHPALTEHTTEDEKKGGWSYIKYYLNPFNIFKGKKHDRSHHS